jgi:phosphate transport system substrate-binding protein
VSTRDRLAFFVCLALMIEGAMLLRGQSSKEVLPPRSLPIVRVKGSDAMKDLVVRLASMYRAADVTVQGGGTAAGVQALADNAADIADASSEIDEEPWAQIERRRHGHVLQTAIGYDVVVIYVNSGSSHSGNSKESWAARFGTGATGRAERANRCIRGGERLWVYELSG